MRRAHHHLAAALLALAACSDAYVWESIHPIVWSEDGQGVAYGIYLLDILHADDSDNLEERNPRFEIWTSAPDGTEQEQWYASAGHAGSLYYMRRAGYVLFASSTFELVRRPGAHGWSRERRGYDDVCDRCSIDAMIPSPSGASIAVSYRSERESGSSQRALEIVRSEDGAAIWGPEIVDDGEIFWTDDESLILARSGRTAWRWSAGVQDLELIELPDCHPPLVPATSSSFIAADGRMVCGGEDRDSPVESCECYYFPDHNPHVGCDQSPDWGALPLKPFGCP